MRKQRRVGTLAAAVLLLLFTALAILQPRVPQYPYLTIDVPAAPGQSGGLALSFLMEGLATTEHCERTLSNLASSLLAVCPQCRAGVRQCLDKPTPEQYRLLSEQPLESYSARLPNGVALYESTIPALAKLACEESERQATTVGPAVRCYAPGATRPAQTQAHDGPTAKSLVLGFGLWATALAAGWFICWLIIRFEHLHSHLSHDHTDSGPQKFHAVPTPRIGGLAVMAGLMAAGTLLSLAETLVSSALLPHSPNQEYSLLLIAALPAFLGGLIEDVTKKVGVLDRLLLTMASGVLAAWLLGAVLTRLDIPGIDDALAWAPLAIVFTAFAVGGVANAVNIIDGYNGLAAGYAAIVLAAFAWVSAEMQDVLLLHVSLSLMGALLGFLIWNWPKGKIFLGDGGAYLLGFLLAELSVLIVVRNPDVSPWFPVLLLIYPVFETMFSIYRRKFARGRSPGHPDALHLHQLIYCRLVRSHPGNPLSRQKTHRNNQVAPFYWIIAMCLAIAGSLLHAHTGILIAGTALFCLAYAWLYGRIVRWETPGWLIRKL